MSYSALLSLREDLEAAKTVYDQIDILSKNEGVYVVGVMDDGLFKIFPAPKALVNCTEEEIRKVSYNLIELKFMPDFDNVDSKIEALEYMGVQLL